MDDGDPLERAAEALRQDGLPEALNRLAGDGARERLAAAEAAVRRQAEERMTVRIGPKEQAVRQMREEPSEEREARKARAKLKREIGREHREAQASGATAAMPLTGREAEAAIRKERRKPAASPPEQESVMATKKATKKAAQKKASPQKKAPPQKAAARTTAAGLDRSPRAVGEFICSYGAAGCPMADLVAQFKMEAHPMRSKIFAARHELGFQVEHDAKRKVYVGKPPKAAKAKAEEPRQEAAQ